MRSDPGRAAARKNHDTGLGQEVIDPRTQIVEVGTHGPSADRLDAAHRRGTAYWVVALIALVLVGEQSFLSVVLYTPVLAELAVEFRTDQVVWVLTAFALASAVLTPLMTKLSDVYGKKRIIVVLSVLAATGALICALAPSFAVLMVGRVLMGVTFAAAPLCVALMRDTFPVRMRAVGIALATNGGGLIVIGGPLLAGWVAGTFGVRAVFLVSAGIALIAGLLSMLVVPESPLRARTRVDYLGALLLGLALFGLLFGLTQLAARGFTDGYVVLSLVGGIAAATLWWQQQKRAQAPLVSVALLRRRPVLSTLSAVFVYCGVAGSMVVLTSLAWAADPEVTTYGFGLTPFEIGLWSVPVGLLTVTSGVVVGLTVKSIGYRNHMIVAAFFWVLPALALGIFVDGPPVVQIVLYGLFGFGNAYIAAAAGLVLLATPEDQRGIASGMNYSLQAVGGAVVQQIAVLVLSANVVGVIGGVPVISENGFRWAYIVCGLVALLALVASLAIPHGRREAGTDRPVGAAAPIGAG